MDDLDIATITKRSINGIVALISRNFILYLISFAAFLVISSKLPPRDVGIYTAVIAMQRIISFFTDFGLGAALVQKKGELDQRDITTSFTIQAGITLFIFLIVFLLSTQIGEIFMLNSQAIVLLQVLVFTIFLSSFKTIPSILLERTINFQKLVIPQIMESLVFNVILILLILRGFQIESFSWAFIISSLIGIPIYYAISPWKIKLGIYKESLTHLKYGTQFQAKNILATIKDDLLTVILVKFLSFTEIGYIGFAQRLAFFVYRYIVDSVTKVTFSTYSRIHENTDHLKKAIEKSLFFISLIMFPILAGIIITAPYIISFSPFGWSNKWEPAIISLIFFCLNAAISSMSSILVNILDATGKVKTTLQLMVIWTILTWTLTPLLIYLYDYNGVAIASFIVSLTILFTTYLVKKVVDFNFIKSIIKPVIATAAMGIVVFGLSQIVVSDFISLLFVILLGGAVYIFMIYLLARQELITDIKTIRLK